MGPTNAALLHLYEADQKLRQAQSRHNAVNKDVRIQERRISELNERLRLAQSKLKEQQSQAGQFDLDVKTRDARIEKLREQQTRASNNREYQAFLVEINTEKADKAQTEEQWMAASVQVEKLQAEVAELNKSLESENAKLADLKSKIVDRVAVISAEIDELSPKRAAAAAAVSAKARDAYERLADRFDGEAMSALSKPDRRKEEYFCTACNVDLVTDIYNKLHTRDELVFCPSCHRILYIPEDLPVEVAVKKVKKEREPRRVSEAARESGPGALVNRQQSAVDVMQSINPEPAEAQPAEAGPSSSGSETGQSS